MGISPNEICELASADLSSGDVLVFYTDGVTRRGEAAGEELWASSAFLRSCAMVLAHGGELRSISNGPLTMRRVGFSR